jgi:hypothetical protein
LLRIRCVHRIGGDVTDHDDPDTYHLEYALIGAYLNRCGNGILHTVEIVTDWVEAEAIEEDLAMRQEGAYVMPRDADRAYWLIDMHLVDWADPCVGVK